MSEELKPCPFCGSKAETDCDGTAVWIGCVECGATVPGRAAAWNHRAYIEQSGAGEPFGYFFKDSPGVWHQCYTPSGKRSPPDFDGREYALPLYAAPQPATAFDRNAEILAHEVLGGGK